VLHAEAVGGTGSAHRQGINTRRDTELYTRLLYILARGFFFLSPRMKSPDGPGYRCPEVNELACPAPKTYLGGICLAFSSVSGMVVPEAKHLELTPLAGSPEGSLC
jgi:hypothetical protein